MLAFQIHGSSLAHSWTNAQIRSNFLLVNRSTPTFLYALEYISNIKLLNQYQKRIMGPLREQYLGLKRLTEGCSQIVG